MSSSRKKILSYSLITVLVIGIIGFFILKEDTEVESEETIEDEVHLTILGTTDIHGNIYNWSYEDGEEDDRGLAKVATIVDEVREENPNTLLIDNGDTVQGTILTDDIYNTDLEDPNPMMDVMNFMKYDAMTLGNHEFNFGLDLVEKIDEEADFPILSANTTYKEDGSYLVQPYTVKEVAGVNVGIIGFTTPNIPRWDGDKVEDLNFAGLKESAKQTVDELKENEEVDIIIATAHAGLDEEYDNDDAARDIIEEVPEIAALLVGHDHAIVEEYIGDTPVGGAEDTGKQVVRFDLTLNHEGDTWSVNDSDINIIDVAEYEANEELKEYAKDYHDRTLAFIAEEIGVATGDFHPESEIKGIPEAQLRDTAVMDLINKIQLDHTDADVSAAALFKKDSNIEEGPITYADVFDIYKFPNTLKLVEITGAELKDYMEWSANYYNTYEPGDINISFNPEMADYRYDMFAGVDYKIDISQPTGDRITDLQLDGEEIQPEDTLKLVLNDYRYTNINEEGEGIISGELLYDSDPISPRSLIVEYIEEEGTIDPEVDNNWEIIGADLDHPIREWIIEEVNEDRIEIPDIDSRESWNSESLNVYKLIEEGKIPSEVLEEHNLDENGDPL